MYRYLVSLVFVLSFMVGNVFADEFKISKPFVQLGHTSNVRSVDITENSKYAISGGDDNTLKLWDINTGRLIRTLSGHGVDVSSVAISPDAKYAVSASENIFGYDKTLRFWNITLGKEMNTVSGLSHAITSIDISPDNKYVLTGSRDKTLKLWDIHTAKIIRTFKGHKGAVNSVAISPNGEYALSGSHDKTMKLWDIKTGEMMLSFDGIFSGHSGSVTSVVFSTDGKYAFSGSKDRTLKQWDVLSGNLIQTFEGHIEEITSIDVTRNGKYILSGSMDSSNFNSSMILKLWDIETGKDIERFKGHTNNVTSLKITSDGKYAISGSRDSIELWNLQTGEKEKKFHSYVEAVIDLEITKDGKYVLYGYGRFNRELKLWNIELAQEIRTFKGHTSNIRSVAITQDSQYAISLSGGSFQEDELKVWDIEMGKEVCNFIDLDSPSMVIITVDSKYALSGNIHSSLQLWDINTCKEIRTFKGPSGGVHSMVISPDGKYALSENHDDPLKLKLWEIQTGKEIRTFTEDVYGYLAVAITPDGKYVLSINLMLDMKLWNMKTGKEIRAFKGQSDLVGPIAITPNSKYAICGGSDKTLKLWDIETGKEIRTFKGHNNQITSLAITQNGKYAISGSSDGTVKYWDIKTGKELLTTISFTDGEWLSITPEGYFNASENGAKHLNILTGPMEVSSIDQYFETFYRPGIVASVMSDTKDVQYASTKPTLKLSDVKPAPEVSIVNTNESTDKEELKVTLKIKPSSGGVGQVRLYLDDVLIKTDGDRAFKRQRSEGIFKTYSIKLPKGKHSVRAIVYNEANTMASKEDRFEVVSTYNPIVKPNIHAVVIGIDEYKNPSIALKYAVADAELFAKTIKAKTKGLYGDVKVQLLTSKEQTSKEFITKTLKDLESISPNDLFIFFVASHGMVEDAKYHMITSNVGALSTRGIKKEAISQELLRDMIANIPTTKKFIILDTCNSGALGQAIEVALLTRGLNETTAMKVLSRAVGSTIISASSSSQEALEGYKGHGLLTYVLSQGLKGKADSDRDGYIKTREIANYIEDTVPEIAEKEFKRAQYPFVSPLGNGFPLVQVK